MGDGDGVVKGGLYTLSAIGTGSGKYRLVISATDETGNSQKTIVAGETASGHEESFYVNFGANLDLQPIVTPVSGVTMIDVPSVTSLTENAAMAFIDSTGLNVGTVSLLASDTVAAGIVIRQDPYAGDKAIPGTSVDLVVSSGPSVIQIAVPDVVGQPQAGAEAAITGAGLVVGGITTASSNTVPAGAVISQNPPAGGNVAPGSTVDLFVSTGVACATNVDAKVSVTQGGFRLNRSTQRYVQQVTLENTGSSSIADSVSLVFDNLSSNATLYGADGTTGSCATPVSPYKEVNVGADNLLSPGERVSVVLEFANPSNQGIKYTTTRVLSGASR